jgi:hypothetical protein
MSIIDIQINSNYIPFLNTNFRWDITLVDSRIPNFGMWNLCRWWLRPVNSSRQQRAPLALHLATDPPQCLGLPARAPRGHLVMVRWDINRCWWTIQWTIDRTFRYILTYQWVLVDIDGFYLRNQHQSDITKDADLLAVTLVLVQFKWILCHTKIWSSLWKLIKTRLPSKMWNDHNWATNWILHHGTVGFNWWLLAQAPIKSPK